MPGRGRQRPAHLVDGFDPFTADLADVQLAGGAPKVDDRAVGLHALHHARHDVADLRGTTGA